jgi:hypothetical protein
LDSKRKLSIYEEYGWVFRSKAQELWSHKVIVKYKYFRKSFSLEALEAAGSGSNLGFNYSHLEKQDKESLTDVVT